jgi:hypothetical protein
MSNESENARRRVRSALGEIDTGFLNNPRKVITVGDEDVSEEQSVRRTFSSFGSDFDMSKGAVRQTQSDIEKKIKEEKESKRRENEFAPKRAVQRFEILLGIGRLVDTVEIEGFSFQFRSLKNKELNHVMGLSSLEATPAMQALFIRSATLAYSLVSIDDVPFGAYIQSEEMSDKAAFIDDMEASVVSKLWDAYTKMLKSHSESIVSDLGGTPEVIAENIKK